jgi:hypothetical protein
MLSGCRDGAGRLHVGRLPFAGVGQRQGILSLKRIDLILNKIYVVREDAAV